MKIPDWLARIFRPSEWRRDSQIDAVGRELERPIDRLDLDTLVPILVPSTFSELGNWPGPICRLDASGFDQTWAVQRPNNVILYVSRTMQSVWERSDIPWRERATNNLRELAEVEPYSHAVAREDGSLYMVVMLYDRGLGPSRLLVPGLLTKIFPEGYEVAVPEMTCAVAFTAKPTSLETQKIGDFISSCFERGTEPVSMKRYRPELFWKLASDDVGLRS